MSVCVSVCACVCLSVCVCACLCLCLRVCIHAHACVFLDHLEAHIPGAVKYTISPQGRISGEL